MRGLPEGGQDEEGPMSLTREELVELKDAIEAYLEGEAVEVRVRGDVKGLWNT